MKFVNAGKLERKSGVRFGERGAPVEIRLVFDILRLQVGHETD
jgi:hypothetical protein